MNDLILGRASSYPDQYAPEVLCALPRDDARRALGLGRQLPFGGQDIWTAWEATWLEPTGKPVVATATIRISADSANIVESKSLKLYLNSFAQSHYRSADALGEVIRGDLTDLLDGAVDVELVTAGRSSTGRIASLPGRLIDEFDGDFSATDVDPQLLRTSGSALVTEELHTHLLRSLCPVTNQPDIGSLLVRYRGRAIDPSSLLGYVVSYRQHNDFHETCVERMFVDIKARCDCRELTVYARYNRRGGIDINPFRSDFESAPDNLRLWRQ